MKVTWGYLPGLQMQTRTPLTAPSAILTLPQSTMVYLVGFSILTFSVFCFFPCWFLFYIYWFITSSLTAGKRAQRGAVLTVEVTRVPSWYTTRMPRRETEPRLLLSCLKLKAHLHPSVIAVVCFYFVSLYCLNAWIDWLNALKLFEKGAISSCTRQLQTTNFANIHRIHSKWGLSNTPKLSGIV